MNRAGDKPFVSKRRNERLPHFPFVAQSTAKGFGEEEGRHWFPGEQKQLLKRLPRVGRTNRFDLSLLFEALQTAVGEEGRPEAQEEGSR